ncbi:P44-4 outer membrane protein, silent, partial [Anaplasma phagocytophilum str. HZ]
NEEDEADTVYLLAKELAYDVVTGQTDNLAAALAKTSGKDIVQFAKAVEISHSGIGKKVCVTKDGHTSQNGQSYGQYDVESDVKTSSGFKVALCGGAGPSDGSGSTSPQFFHDFVEKTLLGNESKNWPTSTAKDKGNTAGKKPEQNDNATAVAKDLVQELTPEEKTMEWALNISGL